MVAWLIWCWEWYDAASLILDRAGRSDRRNWMKLRNRIAEKLRSRWMDPVLWIQAAAISLLVSIAGTVLQVLVLRR
jgi:hypothetical protein